MTSNLASDEIGEYGVKLREEAARLSKMGTDGSVGKFRLLMLAGNSC